MDADVIVAGAGPVGMTAAALLHRAGVTVRVLEREPRPSDWSRGSAVHPRTLELLDALPDGSAGTLGARMADAGVRMPAMHFAGLPSWIPFGQLDTRYPFVLMVPQTTTERFLREHLADAGVPIERGRAVTGLRQDDGGVRVTLDDASELRAGYVVGADGARSAVRQAIGIAFPGAPSRTLGIVADARLGRRPEPAMSWDERRGMFAALPLPDGMSRLFVQDPADVGLDEATVRARRDEPIGLETVRAAIRRVRDDDFGVAEVSRAAWFGDATRHAERFRSGRVLLAGDAAHVHYPSGGLGLNAGVQDAANLAWKLAAEIAGSAPARIVDGPACYDAERRPVAALVGRNTQVQAGLMHTFTPAGRALREMFSELLARGGDTAGELRDWMSGLGTRYAGEDPVGRRVSDLPLTDGTTLHRALRPDRFTLVLAPDAAAPDLGDDVRAGTVRSGTPWQGTAAVLVRPDGYAAAAWAAAGWVSATADDVIEVIAGWTGRFSRARPRGTRAASAARPGPTTGPA